MRATQICDSVQPLPALLTDDHTHMELPQPTAAEPLLAIQPPTVFSQPSYVDAVEFVSEFPPVDK